MKMDNHSNNKKLRELMDHYGFMPDGDLIEFAEIVIEKCIEICKDVGEDVENGNIFFTEKELNENVKNSHLGPIAWYAADEINKYFGWSKETKSIQDLIKEGSK